MSCYMTFWDMTIYNGALKWLDIAPVCWLITELDFITDFDLNTNFGGFHRTLQQVQLANRGRLLLRATGPVQFGTCICSNFERKIFPSWTLHVYGPFEFRTSLGTSILLISSFIQMKWSMTFIGGYRCIEREDNFKNGGKVKRLN